jgi:DNA polymerase III epsilon subunit-like protein
MVRDAPTFADLRREVFERLEGHVLVAHNARFDYGFLKNEFRRVEMKYRADVLCTVRLSRRLYPEAVGHGLDSVVSRHGLQEAFTPGEAPRTGRHSALGDARAIWRFVQMLYRERDAAEIEAAVKRLLKIPSLPPQLAADALENLPEGPGVYPLLRRERPAALHRQEREPARSRALAFLERLPLGERRAHLERDPAHRGGRDRGRAGCAAPGGAPGEGPAAAAQLPPAPEDERGLPSPAGPALGPGSRRQQGHRLGGARRGRRDSLRPVRDEAAREAAASSSSRASTACAGASSDGRSAAGPASRGR